VHVVAPLLTTPVPAPTSASDPAEHVWHVALPDVAAYRPAVQSEHAVVEAILFCPAAHAVHAVAPLLTTPVPAPTSAIDPDEHVWHVLLPDVALYRPAEHVWHVALPDVAYRPAVQSVHAVVEAILLRPAAHAVHVVAPLLTTPVPAPTSAIDPAEHVWHVLPDVAYSPAAQSAHAFVEAVLLCPAAHAVHAVAPLLTTPVPAPTSAIDPTGHAWHVLPDVALYRPAAQSAHAVVEAVLLCPAAHAVHVVAPLLTTPVPAPTSVTDPGGHVVHVPTPLPPPQYVPEPQTVQFGAPLYACPVPAGHCAFTCCTARRAAVASATMYGDQVSLAIICGLLCALVEGTWLSRDGSQQAMPPPRSSTSQQAAYSSRLCHGAGRASCSLRMQKQQGLRP
jgi:hypothetical protein